MFNKVYLSRAQTKSMASEYPIGDPTGGAAYGEFNDPVTAVVAAVGDAIGGAAIADAVGGAAATAATDTGLATLGSSVLPAATAFGTGAGTLATDAALAAGSTGLGAAGTAAATGGLTAAEMAAGSTAPAGFAGANTMSTADALSTLGNAGVTTGGAAVPSTLSDLVSGAKTAGQVIGGLGQIAGGVRAMGGTGVSPQQADPFAQYRSTYAAQLANLLQSPQTVTTTPGYQFNLAQGLQAMQAQQAAQGRLVSGGGLIQAQQFGQNLASQSYQQQLANLASLSGATQAPATGAQAQAGIATQNIGGQLGGLQSIFGGVGQVANPLATLYANYNTATPTA